MQKLASGHTSSTGSVKQKNGAENNGCGSTFFNSHYGLAAVMRRKKNEKQDCGMFYKQNNSDKWL